MSADARKDRLGCRACFCIAPSPPTHSILSSSVAGWGNTGAGAALLLMPLLFEAWSRVVAPDIAWRIAIFVPGVLQLLLGVLVLIATDDSPLGSFPQLR
jgi:NNP family nitrate/nitrite transporter-like MFS transporter